MPADLACPPCRFGRFALEPAERRLLVDGQPASLGARAFDLLVVLVAHAGRLVSKNELLTLVWSGLVVEENNLQVQVSALRKLLGPSALTTIPGRGYRFELPVEDAAAPGKTLPPEAVPVTGPPRVAAASGVAGAAPATTPSPGEAPAIAAPPRAPTNIAHRLSSLYGRADDLVAVRKLVERHVVVTIAGAGGIGKTRLAQAVAAELAAGHRKNFRMGSGGSNWPRWWTARSSPRRRRGCSACNLAATVPRSTSWRACSRRNACCWCSTTAST